MFIIFVGQGAKIFLAYNFVFLTHVMLFLQHLFSLIFFSHGPLGREVRRFHCIWARLLLLLLAHSEYVLVVPFSVRQCTVKWYGTFFVFLDL